MYSRTLRISKNIGFYFEFLHFSGVWKKKKKNFLNSKTKLTSSHLAVEYQKFRECYSMSFYFRIVNTTIIIDVNGDG